MIVFIGWWLTSDVTSRILVWKIFLLVLWRKLTEKLLYRYWPGWSWNITVDCQESYIFPRDYIFPKCAALRDIIVPRGESWHHRHVIFHPSGRSIYVILDGQNEWFPQNFMCSLRLPRSLVARLGVCVQNKTERKLDSLRAFYYDQRLYNTRQESARKMWGLRTSHACVHEDWKGSWGGAKTLS